MPQPLSGVASGPRSGARQCVPTLGRHVLELGPFLEAFRVRLILLLLILLPWWRSGYCDSVFFKYDIYSFVPSLELSSIKSKLTFKFNF